MRLKMFLLFLWVTCALGKILRQEEISCESVTKHVTDRLATDERLLTQGKEGRSYIYEERHYKILVCEVEIKAASMCYPHDIGVTSVSGLPNTNRPKLMTVYAFSPYHGIQYVYDNTGPYSCYNFTCPGGVVMNHCKLVQGDCVIRFNDRGVELESTHKVPYEITTNNRIQSGFLQGSETFPIDNAKTPVYVKCGNHHNFTIAVHTTNLDCVSWLTFFKIPRLLAKNVCLMPVTFSMVFYFCLTFFGITLLNWFKIIWILFPVFYPLLKCWALVCQMFCKKCDRCGSVWHLGHCTTSCECGRIHVSTEMKKRHKETGRCIYSVIIIFKAVLCRKGSTLVFTIVGLGIMSFIPGAIADEKYHPIAVPKEYTALFTGTYEDVDGVKHPTMEIELPLIENSATRIQMISKTSGLHAGDALVRIVKSGYAATYEYKYLVGPTIDYQFEHEEKCTGKCPDFEKFQFKGKHWNKFRMSETSHWGCEEFGCLAIGTGCVWGQCQDVIEPKGKIYEKVEQVDHVAVKFCYQFVKEYKCITMTDKAYKSEEVDAFINYQDVSVLPGVVLCNRSFECYQGDICTSSSFEKKCGNLKMVEGVGMLGVGIPQVELGCHDAQMKDVTINKCYDNNYQSCLALRRMTLSDYAITPSGLKFIHIRDHSRVGTLKLMVRLPDLRFKQLEDKTHVKQVKGTCKGCVNCYKQLLCELDITADDDVVCDVASDDMTPIFTRLFIRSGGDRYYVTGIVNKLAKTIQITICSKSYEIGSIIKDGSETIEFIGHDHYLSKEVYHEDCRTAFCRGSFEMTAILPNLFGFTWILYIKYFLILAVVLVALKFGGFPLYRLLVANLMELQRAFNQSPIKVLPTRQVKKL